MCKLALTKKKTQTKNKKAQTNKKDRPHVCAHNYVQLSYSTAQNTADYHPSLGP